MSDTLGSVSDHVLLARAVLIALGLTLSLGVSLEATSRHLLYRLQPGFFGHGESSTAILFDSFLSSLFDKGESFGEPATSLTFRDFLQETSFSFDATLFLGFSRLAGLLLVLPINMLMMVMVMVTLSVLFLGSSRLLLVPPNTMRMLVMVPISVFFLGSATLVVLRFIALLSEESTTKVSGRISYESGS